MSDASILVLVSDDENASQAVDFAARLASREKSNLVIIYIIEVDLV